MVAVTMSPPQVSSIVIGIPEATQRSRISRALVRPPTLEIFRLIASIASSAIPLSSDVRPRRSSSSSTKGRVVRRRIETLSS